MTARWTLSGSGRRDTQEWDELRTLTDGWTVAWADVAGFHFTRMPAGLPQTTHLWAWAPGSYLRVRVDGRHWWAALLTEGEEQPVGEWSTESCDTVEVVPMLHWPVGERRVKQFRQAEGSQNVLHVHDLYQLTPMSGPATGVFIGHEPLGTD
ncbi:hypothetical protein SAMN06265360_1277 [Haloechinothrix alba]|uniref:Uncharacterized protein n=1 Tax=Haloechinothrix alba TaxID=664784 RepID=A0A238ZYG5_9PSEU|nr:hypothetical protein [Haloechinothrix alba]SNR87918.1 hypothetical protein SAMN06265360_1277 [Haloechinothrix alba]